MEKLFREDCEDIAEFRKITDAVLRYMITVETVDQSIPLNIPTSEYKMLIAELKDMLKSSNFNISNIQESLKAYDPAKVSYFIEAINKRKTQLMLLSIAEHNSSYGDTVTDIDWKLKLVLGTNASNELQYPVLELDLQTLNSNKVVRKKFEFSKVELEKLISNLEKCL